MRNSNGFFRGKSYGKRQDYRNVIRRRERVKDVIVWIVEIAIVIMLAFLAAYFLWR